MGFKSIVCHGLFATLLPSLIVYALATDYTVGGADEGWTLGLNYFDWAQPYNFIVGDALIFNYVKGQHNVYQVVEDSFRSCNGKNGVLKKYDSGNDVVNLTEATGYWFICEISGHCRGGMKFNITVSPASVTETPPPSPPSVPPPPLGSSPAEGNGAAGVTTGLLGSRLSVLGLLFLVNCL